MQSGITASSELHDAFNSFTSNASLFALPITISQESLTALPSIPFTSSSFESSLPSLKEHLQPKTPIYLILRPSPSELTNLIAVTHVPPTAPVRLKMLFASTRNSLTRDLGGEKFGDNLFTTDDFEILDPTQWKARKTGAAQVSHDILSKEERELQSVRRAEEEERHGTSGRDLMGSGGSGSRLAMNVTEDARNALGHLVQEGTSVQLGIELGSETLKLLQSDSNVQAAAFLASIPLKSPSYSFFHYPGTEEIIFLYACPGSSNVKERMVYASARASVLQLAKSEGVNVTKRLEAGDPDEVTEQRLADEAGLNSASLETGAPKQGFAKPKRPGRR